MLFMRLPFEWVNGPNRVPKNNSLHANFYSTLLGPDALYASAHNVLHKSFASTCREYRVARSTLYDCIREPRLRMKGSSAHKEKGFVMDAQGDKVLALERMKWIATSLLLLVITGYVLARVFERRYPGLAVLSAFTEAAMIGALADWFAVVALFRYPMGIPIPHTAIIPKSKRRIADNLATFITSNFLGTAAVLERIRSYDPAARLAQWLSRRESAETLGGYVVRALRYGLAVIEDQRVQRFIHETVVARLEKVDFAALGGELLDVLTQRGRHQELLNEAIRQVRVLLEDEASRQKFAELIAKEFEGLRKYFLYAVNVDEIIGTFSAKKLISAITRLLEEVDQDERHPLRQKFDEFVANFVTRLRRDPDFRIKGEQIREQILGRPELGDYLRGLWVQLRTWLRNDLESADSTIRIQIAAATGRLGEKLSGDPDIQLWLNEQILAAVKPFVEDNREAIGRFIADQVKAWDERHMIQQFELNIGKDLQYIRINGTLVGGLIGLLIYGGTRLIPA